MRQTRTSAFLILVLTCVAPIALAAPAQRDRSLDGRLRQTVRAVAKHARARGAAPVEIRGRVQEAMVGQLKVERARQEHAAMKRAGLEVPYREVRAFVEREFEAFVQKGFERPSGWDELSPGKQFGVFFKAAKQSFAGERTFPGNFAALDPAGRAGVARCFAGNCSLKAAPGELEKWLRLTGGASTAPKRPLSSVEKLLALSAGGAKPAPKIYYGAETAKAIENFQITGQRVPHDLIVAVAEVKAAAAIANMRTGRLDRKIGGAIVKAAREIRSGRFADQFVTDPIQGGAGTSVNMNVNEVIASRAAEIVGGRIDSKLVHANDHVNMAQSTNDVYPTAARIAAYRRLKSLLGSYELLVKELDAKGVEYAALPKPGRTHLEDAVPIMLGREFKAYAAVLKRDMRDIKVAMKGLTSVNLGGTAVGTALNAEPAYVKNVAKVLAHVSGVPLHRTRDLVDGTQNVDAMTRAHAALKVSSSNLIKICNDLRMMNSGPRAGLAEIALPEMQKGSSIMPGKVNPVIAEVMNQISYQVQGNDLTVNLVAQNGQFELNQMEPVMVHNLLGSIQILDRGARALAERAIRGLKANDEACLRGARQMLGLATALVPKLGYDRSAQLAKTALKTGKSLQELAVESGDLQAAEAARLLDPARMARGGVLK